jgi:uncharacterized protein (DUF1501 family)
MHTHPTAQAKPWARGRRGFLRAMACAGLVSGAHLRSAWGRAASPLSPRLVFVVLRGGLDGLMAVPALGDPEFERARGPLAVYEQPVLPLDGFFGLHPALAQVHGLYRAQEALVLHAVGLPGSGRSHFDAQQLLESGGLAPYQTDSGWLARALGGGQAGRALSMSTALPLSLRGGPDAHMGADTWTPSVLPEPSAELVARLQRVYAPDAPLAQALADAQALRERAVAPQRMASGPAGGRQAGRFEAVALQGAHFLAAPGGPQVLVMDMGGWDSHAGAANPNGPLANNLRQLDAGLGAMAQHLRASGVWSQTRVLVVTEFGREVAVNGTLGTDHGSAGAALMLGGGLRGGRVLSDWPGLAPRQRFEGRDLRVTQGLREVFAQVLVHHLGLSAASVARDILPGLAPGWVQPVWAANAS